MKKATIFGGARTSEKVYNDTVAIGKLLHEKGYTVRTGGYGGTMEAASKGAAEAGGEPTGVTCATFPSSRGNKYLANTIVADDLYHRLRILIDESDLFIIQHGGIGTLAELYLTMDIARKKKVDRPTIILVGGIWRGIITATEALLTNNENSSLIIVDEYTEIENHL